MNDFMNNENNVAHNFSFIMLVSTINDNIPCEHCADAEKYFDSARQSYLQSLDNGEGKKDVMSHNPLFYEHPMFWVRCDVRKCIDMIRKAQWQTVPQIIWIPPKQDKGAYNPLSWRDVGDCKDAKPPKIGRFVTQYTGYYLKISPPLSELIIFYSGIIGTLVITYFFVLPLLKKYWKNPLFLFTIAMIPYVITMMGLVFNAINNPPYDYDHPQNGKMYFYPSSRNQFVIEGQIMAVVLTILPLCFIAFTHLVPIGKSEKPIPMAQRGIFWIIAAFFIVTMRFTIQTYFMKHPYIPFP